MREYTFLGAIMHVWGPIIVNVEVARHGRMLMGMSFRILGPILISYVTDVRRRTNELLLESCYDYDTTVQCSSSHK